MHSNWTPIEGSDSLEKGGYGNNTGKASGTEWLLAQVWEHLQPAKPHVIGTLINDVESEDKLVPTELLVLTQLIMATMNMKRRVEYTVFPVLLISILGKQQARIIEGQFDGKNVIVRYSKLYDFREKRSAPINLFLRWLMCTPVEKLYI